ncbi:MAG: fasciclin domain-containing protein [Marinifilaceae bacterium]
MKILQNSLIILLALFLGVGCEDPHSKEEFAAYSEQPIGIYLENQRDYSLWVELLKKADHYNALNVNTQFTCFAVRNAGVERYLKKNTQWSSIDDITETEAANIVRYHIVPGVPYSYGALGGQLTDKTCSGDYLIAELSGENKTINGNEIANRDIEVINGVIHELVDVLEPPLYTVKELLEDAGDYTILVAAFKECGYEHYLSRRDTIINKIQVRDYKTVFAVSDETFAQYGIYSLDDLKNKYPGDPTNKRSEFHMFVAYHIVPGSYDYMSMVSFDVGQKGKNFQTCAIGQFLTMYDVGLETYINPHLDSVSMVEDKRDYLANNGYYHRVDKLMDVAAPIAFAFEHEFTTGKEFEAIPFYRTPKVKNQDPMEFYTFTEQLPNIRWKSIPQEVAVVTYRNEDIDWDRFSHDDYIHCYLGDIGYIEFDIPMIIPGKYKIEIVKWQWNVIAGNEAGSCQLYIDDQKFGPVINHKVGTGGTINLGEFDFKELSEHIFRFRQVAAGGLGFDRLIFTPVEKK